MPLPFTNVWDQTFPADTALVSQGAANLRQLRVDVQQRMAAISGTDAARPNFSADAQPTQWYGVLYFALDTAQVYQWSGSSWVNVTTKIGSGSSAAGVLSKNTSSITLSNSTVETNIFTTSVPVLSTTAILRVRMNFVVDTWVAQFNVIWRWNGVQILSAPYPSGAGGTVMGSELFIANRTVTNAQQWNMYFTIAFNGSVQNGSGGGWVGETNIDTTAASTLTCSVLDAAAGNTETFNLWLVELL